MNDTASAAVLRNTFTLTELYQRAEILQRFLEHAFFEAGATPLTGRAQMLRAYYAQSDDAVKVHAEAVAKWGDDVLAPFDARNVYDGVRALQHAIESLPRFTLYVPVGLTPAQIAPIGVWCRAHIHAEVMIDLKIDPDVVGGCAFVYQNAYHDFSLSYFINKNRDAFLKLANAYDA